MIDDGILPDDIIIVRHQTYADNGDVEVRGKFVDLLRQGG